MPTPFNSDFIEFKNFRGLFKRGSMNEITPLDHSTEAQNVMFSPNAVRCRYGADVFLTPNASAFGISRYYFRSTESGTTYLIYLCNRAGTYYLKSYNMATSVQTTLLTIPIQIKDFSIVDWGNRIFISLHDAEKGLTGTYAIAVYCYDGTTFRQAAGYAPRAAAMSAADGIVASTGKINTIAINANGHGYHIGDVLTVVQTGGAGGTATVGAIASATGAISALTINAAGVGYTVGDILDIAHTNASGGKAAVATVNPNSNPIATVSINAAGSGYHVNDILTVAGGSGGKVKVTSVATYPGKITSSNISSGGLGYNVYDRIYISNGSTWRVDSVSSGTITGVTLESDAGNNLVGTYSTYGGSGTGATISISATDGATDTVTGISLDTAGTGYSVSTGNATTGGYGTGCKVNITEITPAHSSVTGVTVNAGGNGYPVSSANATSGGTGTGCTLNVTGIVADDGVSSITLSAAGTGYQDQTGLATTVAPAGGTGCTVDITTIPAVNLDAGVHKFAVAYEFNWGYITQPGPKVQNAVTLVWEFSPTTYTAPGGKTCNLSGIPVGGTGVVARHILATKAGGEEYFFVPNGRIDENTSTTLTVAFADTSLVESADYLFDQLEVIPSCVNMGVYSNRMVYLGVYGLTATDANKIYVSRSGDPESINEVDGLIAPIYHNKARLKNLFSFRGMLYILRTAGVIALQDNGSDPATWPIVPIDDNIGTEPHGVMAIANSSGNTVQDVVLVAARSGLYVFNGTFQSPELSWKIFDLWNAIPASSFWKTQIIVHPTQNEMLIVLPSSSISGLMLYADFSEGLNSKAIKWSVWRVQNLVLDSIATYYDFTSSPVFTAADAVEGIIYSLTASNPVGQDDGIVIDSYIKTAYGILRRSAPGALNLFNFIRARISGILRAKFGLFSLDDKVTEIGVENRTLSVPSGQETGALCNIINERIAVKVYLAELNSGTFRAANLTSITVFGKQYGVMRNMKWS